MALLDVNGATMVEYKYDAWGKPLSTTGTMAATLGKLNPFRYRGYVYDEESGLYYLRTRYYNPEICRFINADSTKYLWNGTESVIVNLFEFCNNNPVMGYDPDGTFDWKKGLTVGLAAIGIGLLLLAAVPTGGASLAVGGYLVSGAAISSAGTATVIAGAVVTSTSIMYASSSKYGGGSTYNKEGTRVDYEYNGNGSGNVHIHSNNEKTFLWRMKDAVGEFLEVSKPIMKIIGATSISRAVQKAIDIVETLGGK